MFRRVGSEIHVIVDNKILATKPVSEFRMMTEAQKNAWTWSVYYVQVSFDANGNVVARMSVALKPINYITLDFVIDNPSDSDKVK